tara:strand:+ start:30 stop:317 length:288 start_codon:yes stop_codon:yes gene_type:complete
VYGRLHSILVGSTVNGDTRSIVHAETYDWPSVVQPRTDQVQLIAALWSVFVKPNIPRFRMESESLSVSMTIRPNLRMHSLLAYEGVVFGNATVFM